MVRSIVSKINGHQVMWLPAEIALPAGIREVEITTLGRSRIISPGSASWDAFFDGPAVSDDFMTERKNPRPRSG
jgi:antitoxin VapB